MVRENRKVASQKIINKAKIMEYKLFLYFTEFFAGMSVMAVELGANRLLAPYFSSSQIVWTIIIGTIMIAMALGNIYGGRAADKNPDPGIFYKRVLVAAVWIALIPVLGKYVVIGISALMIFAVNHSFLVAASFVSCIVLFVYPLFLLGTATPCLVKYTMNNLEDNGRVIGNMEAFNTVGSIIGTFVPTFITIPLIGTSVTFLIFAGILLLLAGSYFLSVGKEVKKVLAAAACILGCCFIGHEDSFAFWEKNLVYEGESVYNYLQVKETKEEVILSTNVLFGVQSLYRKDTQLSGMYYDYAMAALLMLKEEASKVLVLGMGTGTYATQCMKYFGEIEFTGVEIDGQITTLSREYFYLPEDIPVVTYDGRAYLNATDEKYDVIMVDAYQDITIPFQMSTIEFFTLVKEHLSEDGVLVVNMNMHGMNEENISQYLADTIAAVFDEVYLVDVQGATNRELYASDNPQIHENLVRNSEKINDVDLHRLMKTVCGRMQDYEEGYCILTDDLAPVELLGMRMMDELIQKEVEFIKTIYKEEGLWGVWTILSSLFA